MATDYTLRLSESEQFRYRMMASIAREAEGDLWQMAGIEKGARVVDLGCGPGAVLLELARLVGPEGRVVGVDQDAEARETATAWAAQDGLDNVEIREGLATDTGLPPGEWDAVMMRHVLIHNGPRVPAILAHVLALLKPGGCAVLDETDGNAIRYARRLPAEAVEMERRWWGMLADGGNDVEIGARVGDLAEEAGFEVLARRGRYDIFPVVPQLRPASWAARHHMLEAGACTEDDIARWDRALTAYAEQGAGGFVHLPNFTVVARKPVA
jgi:precorrin-6B methylase 2